MAEISMPRLFPRHNPSQHAPYGLRVWGLIALVSCVFWGMQVWQWSGPMTSPAPVVVSRPVVSQVAPALWAPLLLTGASAPNPNSTVSQWKLLGVVSGQGGTGLAMLVSPSGDELMARNGDTVAPGLVLLQVHADRVLLGADEQSATQLSMPAPPQQ